MRKLLFIAVMLFAAGAFAGPAPEAAPEGFDWMSVVAQAITVATPIICTLVVSGVRKLVPKIPPAALPLLSAVLGIIINVVQQQAASADSILVGAVLGLAGTGLYEAQKNLKPAPKPD